MTVLTVLTVAAPRAASAQLDPTGRWRTFETAHFSIHFREEYRETGLRAAAEAEAAWDDLAAILPLPTRRVELVVADNVDDPNGFASTFPLPRIVVYAQPPAGDLQLEAYDRWLRLVVTHELAHIFHLDQARGLWRVARSLLGRAPFLFPNQYTTPWMREGLAVFYESRVTGRGRLGNAFHTGMVRAAAEEQGGLRLDAANTPSPRWPAGLRPYAFGSAFMDAAAQLHGDSVVSGFAESLAGKLIPYVQLGPAWRGVSGEGIAQSWSRMLWVPEQPDGRDGRDGRDGQTTLLAGLRLPLAARVSADGRYVAFAHNDGRDVTRLVVMDRSAPPGPDSAPAWRSVARLNHLSGLAWMPDGRVLVSQVEYLDPWTIRSDLWAVAMDGREQRLSHGQRLREADIAADGAIVAVRSVPGGNELVLVGAGTRGGGDAAVMDRDIRVIASGDGVEYAGPRFDGAGRTIAVLRVVSGRHDLVLLDRGGTIIREITRDRVADLHPAWSPDGEWLTWSRDVGGRHQVVGMRAGQGGMLRLTDERYGAYAPAAAGDTLFYIAIHADGYRLVRRPLGGPELPAPAPDDAPLAPGPQPRILAEHAYRSLPAALPQYWIPQLFVETKGAWFGGLTSGSDALGRHSWTGSFLAGLGSLGGQVSAGISWLYAGLKPVLLDAAWSHRPGLILAIQSGPGGPITPTVACCLPDNEAHAGVSLRRLRMRAQATVRVGVETTRDAQARRRGFSVGGALARTRTSALAISTQDGWRLDANLRYRRRSDGATSTQTVVRGAAYLSSESGLFARQVFATRAALGLINGTDNLVFSVGGVSSSSLEVLPGVALGGGARTFQVRGYAPGTIAGRRALGVSVENRVPLALVGRGLGMVPLGVDRVSASLFTDAAMAWSVAYCPSQGAGSGGGACGTWIWSVGAELATDLGLAYDIGLRVRIGGALRITDNGKPGAWVALGSAF